MERLGDARGLIEYLNVAGKINVASENDLVGSTEHPHIPASIKGTEHCVDLLSGAVRRISIWCRTAPLSQIAVEGRVYEVKSEGIK
jgi:hypothetical protein